MSGTLAAVTIIGAVLTSTVGPCAVLWMGHKLRTENTEQHAENGAILSRVESKVDTIDEKVDVHGERLAVVEDRLDIPRAVAQR